ncbi:MAG: hypothetical protein IJA16_02455 [Clostridia bacterium]|nr:hypothetical protein [Clostridia bacterium]
MSRYNKNLGDFGEDMAERYYERHPFDGEVRFDVVEVFAALSGGAPELFEIRHIEDAIMF